jgi:hypothetical protein
MSAVKCNVFRISFKGRCGAGPVSVPDFEPGDHIIHVLHNGEPIGVRSVFSVSADTGLLEQTTDADFSEHEFEVVVLREAPPEPDDPPAEEKAKGKATKGDST